MTGQLPLWWSGRRGGAAGLRGLSGLLDDVGDVFESLVCTSGVGKVVGTLLGGGSNVGGAAGDRGQAVLQDQVGCDPGGSTPAPAAPVPEPWYSQVPIWAWAAGSIVLLTGTGAAIYFATRRARR